MASDGNGSRGFHQQRHNSGEEEVLLLQADADAESLASDTPSTLIPETLVSTKWITLLLVGILALFFETGNAMRAAALIASYEDIICHSRAEIRATPVMQCSKNHEVERELALILGVSQFLECLPILLLSGFYGSMADKYGRRPILQLGYLGMILSSTWVTGVAWLAPAVPLRLVWLSPIFTVVGGGPGVPISILMTSAADVVLPSQRVTVYSYIHGTALVAVMLGSLLSSLMMTSLGNLSPLLTGLALMCLALALGFFLPSQRNTTKSFTTASDSDFYLKPSDDSDASSPVQAQGGRNFSVRALSQSFQNLWRIKGVIPLLIAGFVSMLGQQVQILVLQYVPNRFDVSIAKANMFNILISGVNLLILFALLPLAGLLISRRLGYTTFVKDLVLAHASNLLFLTGALVLSMAPVLPIAFIGFIIFGAGIGLSSLLRSIFVELFPPERAAYATTVISAVKSVGGSFSGPMYSSAFALSLGLEGFLQGLPFLVSAASFAIVELVLITVRFTYK
ncbi:hypothetical protein MMC27_008800 [Xylographa pallens]|nr:hypothetical protein [Xylographa pallens]